MIKYYIIASICITILMASWGYGNYTSVVLEGDMTVSSLREKLGEDLSAKKPDLTIKGVSAEVGKGLFETGFAKKPNGGKSKRQSKHFVCTSCHNVKREDPDLTVSDPQARLMYTARDSMPFLQGTTMYGAVSRETYYNGDYDKKYGKLVSAARHSIRGAIQLCAVECAQGRSLKDWELESILAYLWTIDLKVSDLDITQVQKDTFADDLIENEIKLSLLKSKYLLGSPAHFILPPADRKAGTGHMGIASNGKLIYENSCLHCHYRKKYSFLHLDKSKLSFKYLKRKAPTYHNHSLYQVVRWGVPTKSGKRSYMPQYPVEKMSNQQLSDLMSYIVQEAKR